MITSILFELTCICIAILSHVLTASTNCLKKRLRNALNTGRKNEYETYFRNIKCYQISLRLISRLDFLMITCLHTSHCLFSPTFYAPRSSWYIALPSLPPSKFVRSLSLKPFGILIFLVGELIDINGKD